MEPLEYIRLFNIIVACFALGAGIAKGYHLKFWVVLGSDSQMRFLANIGWCLAYIIAGILSTAHGFEPNIWTTCFVVPVVWSLFASLRGWKDYTITVVEDGRVLGAGLMTANEMRARRHDIDVHNEEK